PPGSVSLALHGGTLEARGAAPARWIEDARRAAAALPGVEAFTSDRLYATEDIADAHALADAIDGTEILFGEGSSEPGSRAIAALDRVAEDARRLLALAPRAGLTTRLEIVGYSDPIGSGAANQDIARARAERIGDELRARGVPASDLEARGEGVRTSVL